MSYELGGINYGFELGLSLLFFGPARKGYSEGDTEMVWSKYEPKPAE